MILLRARVNQPAGKEEPGLNSLYSGTRNYLWSPLSRGSLSHAARVSGSNPSLLPFRLVLLSSCCRTSPPPQHLPLYPPFTRPSLPSHQLSLTQPLPTYFLPTGSPSHILVMLLLLLPYLPPGSTCPLTCIPATTTLMTTLPSPGMETRLAKNS